MSIMIPLIVFSLVIALVVRFMKTQKAFAFTVRLGAAGVIVLSIVYAVCNFNNVVTFDLSNYEWIKYPVLALELLITGYIVFRGISSKKFLVAIFATLQFGLIAWFELTQENNITVKNDIYIDKISLLMILIIGVVGGLICLYSVEYMKAYHHHHPEFEDRRGFFFSVLFLFTAAMFGLVMFNNMTLMLFCWEITSLSSFLLIGYTKTDEAVNNAFTALVVNVFGGLCFTIGIVILGMHSHVLDFNSLMNLSNNNTVVMLAVLLIAVGGLTKSAQMPFSKWLLGAMVAPTPSSAILHSSTMVKAGVYLIIRLAPLLGSNAPGYTVAFVGGITFMYGAFMAISQRDAKKILAFSTISNLGLIVTCASLNTPEALWAAIMLIVFHAISKALLFLTVGSTEHQIGSRDVESMDGLVNVSKAVSMCLIIGIAGMFIAPFGMLISKWAAIKALIDSGNIIILLIVAFGSTVTMFFWTKWLGKIIANAHNKKKIDNTLRFDEKASLFSLSAMVVIVCAGHPLISKYIITPYIQNNMGINFSSPIDPVATTIIIAMMCVLFILPLIFVPLYHAHKEKPSSIYMSGENTGDDESFHGSLGQVQSVELQNWYMQGIFKEVKWCSWASAIVLVVGLLSIVGGFFL
ncbi:MAG: proton-conducting transporter membrane subunit [Bacillota bacterium]|nr:proton-conducting transporter membrane subunit [Bacillota bacterium]